MNSIKRIAILALMTVTFIANASDEAERRPISSTYTLEVGAARNLSTYLSPLYYNGTSYSLTGSWVKAFNRWSDRCDMRFEAALDLDNTMNPARTAYIYGLTARFEWGLSWSRRFGNSWKFNLGPMLDIYGGALYAPRNGNNPVTALATAGIVTSAALAYHTRFGKFPIVISDEAFIPTLSAFFCPGYGESYYEIYLGNHKDLMHFGWWGNTWGFNNLLSIRIKFGTKFLLLGYRLNLRTFKANNLQTQTMHNSFALGISL